MRVALNTDIAGNPIRSKNYTAELTQLIADTSGGVRDTGGDRPAGDKHGAGGGRSESKIYEREKGRGQGPSWVVLALVLFRDLDLVALISYNHGPRLT